MSRDSPDSSVSEVELKECGCRLGRARVSKRVVNSLAGAAVALVMRHVKAPSHDSAKLPSHAHVITSEPTSTFTPH